MGFDGPHLHREHGSEALLDEDVVVLDLGLLDAFPQLPEAELVRPFRFGELKQILEIFWRQKTAISYQRNF
jgi:hypothetical protein